MVTLYHLSPKPNLTTLIPSVPVDCTGVKYGTEPFVFLTPKWLLDYWLDLLTPYKQTQDWHLYSTDLTGTKNLFLSIPEPPDYWGFTQTFDYIWQASDLIDDYDTFEDFFEDVLEDAQMSAYNLTLWPSEDIDITIDLSQFLVSELVEVEYLGPYYQGKSL